MTLIETRSARERDAAISVHKLFTCAHMAAVYDRLAAGEVLTRFVSDEITLDQAYDHIMQIVNPDLPPLPIGRA
jgi:hypothetical protein